MQNNILEQFDYSRERQIQSYLNSCKQKRLLDTVHKKNDQSIEQEEEEISGGQSFNISHLVNKNSQNQQYKPKKSQKKQKNFFKVQNNIRKFIRRIKELNPFVRSADLLNYRKLQLINDNAVICESSHDYKNFQKKAKTVNQTQISKFDNDIQEEDEQIDKNFSQFQFFKAFAVFVEKIPTIQNDSTFLLTWNIINALLKISLVFIYSFNQFFYMPLYQCENSYLFSLSYSIILILLLIDVLINFNKVYIYQGVFIYEKKSIALHYFKNDFIPDILGIIPLLNTVTQIRCQRDHIIQIDVNFCLNFLIYLMIYNFYDSMKELEKQLASNSKRKMVINLSKLIFLIILLAHFTGCALKFLADFENQILRQDSWLKNYDLINDYWYVQYIYSFYWASATMITVGFGDFVPQTPMETIFISFCMMLGCGVFGFSINQIGVIIQEMQKTTLEQETEKEILTQYLHKKNITKDLTQRSLIYLQYVQKINDFHKQEKEIFKKLSPLLRKEIDQQIFQNLITQFQVLYKNFSKNSLEKLQKCVSEQIYTPGEIIYYQNCADQYIYLLADGEVQLIAMPDNIQKTLDQYQAYESMLDHPKMNHHKEINISTVKKGQTFGELGFFKGHNNETTAKSSSFSVVYKIHRKDFLEILKSNKQDFEKFWQMKESVKWSQEYKLIKKKCEGCNVQTKHLSNDCPFMHFVIDKARFAYKYSSAKQHRQENWNKGSRLHMRTLAQLEQIQEKCEDYQCTLYFKEMKSEVSSYPSNPFALRQLSGMRPLSIEDQDQLVQLSSQKNLQADGEESPRKKMFKLTQEDECASPMARRNLRLNSKQITQHETQVEKEKEKEKSHYSNFSFQDRNVIFTLINENDTQNVSFDIDLPAEFDYFYFHDNRSEKIKSYNKIMKTLKKKFKKDKIEKQEDRAKRQSIQFLLKYYDY